MSLSSTIATVRQLKQSLTKELEDEGGGNHERIIDLLRGLDECPGVNLAVLSETLVGAAVSKFKSHANTDISNAARSLVKKWKKLAKQGGVGGEKSLDDKVSPAASAPRRSLNGVSSGAKLVASSASSKKLSVTNTAETAAAEAEWSDLPPLRKNICNKLHSTLSLSKPSLLKSGFNAEALNTLCTSRSSEVENAIQTHSRGERQPYTEKARSLIFNLKKNAPLRENVLMGSTPPDSLVKMSSDELATSEKAKARQDEVARVQDSRRLDWEQANEEKINEMCGIKGDLLKASLFTCGRCKSTKTTSTQKQTRSADEPMTVFVLCMNCGKRWKC